MNADADANVDGMAYGRKSRSPAKRSRSRSRSPKRSNPKTKRACAKAHMVFIAGHKSKDAKGKSIKVKGHCKKHKSMSRK